MLKLAYALMAITVAFANPAKDAERSRTRAETETRIFRQLLIRVKSKADEPSLKAALPRDAQIIGRQSTMYVVRFAEPVTEQKLKELKALPFVAHVERDMPSYPQQLEDLDACEDPTLQGLPLNFPTALSQVAQANGPCTLTEICAGNDRVKLWAQERVQADAMANEPYIKALKNSHTKVAVIDTGFDVTKNRALIVNADFEVKKGYDGAGDPGKDEGGHGTMVVGVIAAKDGVGIAPQAKVTSYRITEPRYTGDGVSNATLKLAIQRACDDGNEVINLSWGGLLDEAGSVRDEVSDKAFYDGLAKKGCLVVKAAGNDGFRNDYASNNPDDAYLRVAATAPHGALAKFSSSGEIAAPGAGVFTLESADIYNESKADSADLCASSPGRFVSGTSFAAPITAAIAAQVMGVLKQSRAYGALGGPERISLVNRILIASQFGGTVNALRAAMIAHRWGTGGMVVNRERPATVAELKQLLEVLKNESCTEPVQICANLSDCKKMKDCVRNKRVAIAVCEPTSLPAVRDVLESDLATGNFEGAISSLRIFRELSKGQTRIAGDTKNYDEEIWLGFRSRWETAGGFSKDLSEATSRELNLNAALDFDVALELLPAYLESRADTDAGRDEGLLALKQFFESYKVGHRLRDEEKKGVKADLDRTVAVLEVALKKLGRERFLKAVGSFIHEQEESILPAPARLIDLILSKSEFVADEAVKAGLLSHETSIYDRLVADDTTLIYFQRYSNYAPLLKRHLNRIQPKFEKALATDSASELGAAEVVFLFSDEGGLTIEQREQLALVVLKNLSRGAGWRYVDDNLAEEAFATLRRSSKAASYLPQLQALLESSNNLGLIKKIFPRVSGNKVMDYDLKDLSKKTLFPKEFLFAMARKMSLSYLAQTSMAVEKNYLEQKAVFEDTLPYLISDPKPDAEPGKKVKVAVNFESETHRLQTPPPIEFKEVESRSVPQTLDAMLAKMFTEFQAGFQNDAKYGVNERLQTYGYRSIEAIIKNPEALKLLPKDGAWKTAYKALLEDAKTNTRYSRRTFDEMDKILGGIAGL